MSSNKNASKNKGSKPSHRNAGREDKGGTEGKQRIKKSPKRKKGKGKQSNAQPLALVPPEKEEPPPLSIFSGTLKQIDIAALSESARKVFTYYFPLFESLDRMPAGLSGEGRILSLDSRFEAHYIGVRQRRFAGDETLPRGRYWAVESASDPEYQLSDLAFNAENNQVVRELFSYAEPFRRVDPKLLDSTVDTGEVSQLANLGIAEVTNPCILQIINPHTKGALPATLGIDSGELTAIEYPLRITAITIPDVLDLRMPSAASWLVNFCASREVQVVKALKIKKPESPTVYFTRLLRFLLHQEAGGSLPLLQGIGAWLRSNGVAGLVFPSARCDSGVIVRNGEVISWWGFNYVDYRGSSHVEWQDHFGRTARVPNMEDRVRFSFGLDRKLSGTWFVEGIVEWQVLRYAAMKEKFTEKTHEARARLRDGSIYVSDSVVALFGPEGLWYMNDFPTVGHFIAYLVSGIEVLGDPSTFTYDSVSWFLVRDTSSSSNQLLLCPRCGRVLIMEDVQADDIPASCPSCGLGDREAHAHWEPGENWPETPFLG